MSVTDNDKEPEDDARSSRDDRGGWGRRRIALGALGLAAVLGTGAYVITDQLTGRQSEDARPVDVPVAAPVAPASGSTVSATPEGPTAEPSTSAQATPSAAPSSLSASVMESIREARRKMAEDGVRVQRPIQPKTTRTAEDVQMTTQGSLKEGGIVRVVSAPEDLTGQRELAWVAGGVTRHRGVECSQTVRLSNDAQPQRKPNLLICWRTSAKKSVIAIVVDPQGRPSRSKAVGALEKKWRSIG